MQQAVRVPISDDTLDALRELAMAERRATVDQAAVLLERAVRAARRASRGQPEPKR